MSDYVDGKLLIIGGAEDKKGECKILKRFIQEAGGRESVITVLTAATELPEQVGEEYQELFTKLGGGEIQVLDVADRGGANHESIVRELQKSSGVFFTGGDQLRITGMIGGTLLGKALHQLYERGVIIAGTSAGASVMSDTMIVGGEAGTPKKDTLTMAPGLGLLRSVVIDQHFAQRGRIGRLLMAVSQNPYVLGVGIDEDTSILVHSDGRFFVVGKNTVTVVDASPTIASNVSEISPGQALVLTPVLMHVLSEGYGFDLKRRVAHFHA
ncbi:cyanophycinase [Desulfitobacterium metallireducens]|uniref:Cyanophycinase n=1 Tax=Desulfitobacterium metallireducens DSM 15288 TaxID=871968 RepID=W0E930_9FIRM|nr:cyanophycinase [Desulfitobacterium metallireducens]AHF05709.1 cyanophycinase [Desulfitobacterium metallireducens DSM 15288]